MKRYIKDHYVDGWPIKDVLTGEHLDKDSTINRLNKLNAELSRYSMSAGAADQFKAEALAARHALGFGPDDDCVAPVDIAREILKLQGK